MPTTVIAPDGSYAPVEIAPGRGDLRYTSQPFSPESISLGLLGGRNISFGNLFATQPWVAAAVMRMLTSSIRVPLKAYRRDGDDSRVRLRPGDHPIANAIAAPWERAGAAQLTMAFLGPLLVHGNSLFRVEDGPNRVQLSPKDWRFAEPVKIWRDEISGWKLDVDDQNMKDQASVDECVHTAWWSPLGPLGISPLQQLGVTLKIEDAAQRWQHSIFQNGARPPSAITATEEFLSLDRDERTAIMTQLRADVNTLFAGPENAGRPAMLPPGLDWKEIGHSAVEAELIDQRKVAREEVAAVYLMPPPMIGILDKATFSNIEIQREMLYTESLGPPLVLIEQAINSQIIQHMMGDREVYVEYDFAGVLRGDRLKEIEALREAISIALLTPNEGRAVLNAARSDDEGMDTFYLPSNNLQPVGTPAKPQTTVTTNLPPGGAVSVTLPTDREIKEFAHA